MRVLIIGSGFIGRTLAAHLLRNGHDAVLASRNPPADDRTSPAPWTALDVTDEQACARVFRMTGPDAAVLVHGPSDVTWCDEHPEEAMDGHLRAARNVAAAGDRRLVLISTDNVFDGTAPACDEDEPTAPHNAYGRAKLAAEQVLAGARATVLRVSLVYGWEPQNSGKWLNFFSSCAHRLRAGEPVTVPHDQWTTPVLVDDVAAVTTAVLAAPGEPLLHLGGPDRVSRADWARVIAAEVGADPALVATEPRSAGRYAGRPENTCLTSKYLDRQAATSAIRLHGVRGAARLLLDGAGPSAPGVR